jgi:hypothetical protein
LSQIEFTGDGLKTILLFNKILLRIRDNFTF